MIIISSGMQKAGSASYFNLCNDLLIAAGFQDTRKLRSKYGFGFFMSKVNCNIGPPRAYKLAWLSLPHWLGDSFVVKTHEAPTSSVRILLKTEIVKSSYIFRDPRDVALSLFDHGERLRVRKKISNTKFDHITSIDSAIRFTSKLLPIWSEWTRLNNVLIVRFESYIKNLTREAMRFCQHVDLDLSHEKLMDTVSRYDINRSEHKEGPQFTHFNVGKVGRWKEVMSDDQKIMCEDLYGDYLASMGY